MENQKLFNYLSEELGVTALSTNLQEIVEIVLSESSLHQELITDYKNMTQFCDCGSPEFEGDEDLLGRPSCSNCGFLDPTAK